MPPRLATARAVDISDQAADHFNNPDTAGKLFIPDRAREGISLGNTLGFHYASMQEAFPDVDAGHIPTGNMVLFQVRQPKFRTEGGIIIDTETRKTEFYNTQVAKVIAVGPIAFQRRDTGEIWPEGIWYKPGDFVRIPKYQGDRFTVAYERPDFEIDPKTGRRKEIIAQDEVHFVLNKELSVSAIVKEPLTVKAFL